MTGDRVPDVDHVARYCSPRQVENGSPRWGAFQPRVGEDYLSVNWLEFFGANDLATAVDEMREVFGASFDLRASGRFAVLNVGDAALRVLEDTGYAVRAEHLPTDDNSSHAGIVGYSHDDAEVARTLAEMVRREDVYPAIG